MNWGNTRWDEDVTHMAQKRGQGDVAEALKQQKMTLSNSSYMRNQETIKSCGVVQACGFMLLSKHMWVTREAV